MRGQCGKESFFGAELPCPYNGLAVDPEAGLRETLIDLCGENFREGPVCCDAAQLSNLRENLGKAESLITTCPACKTNFVDFFCTFTCSPDQSEFLSIEDTTKSTSGKDIITHLSHYVSKPSADGFYDSCKNVKFSATNGYVMDLLGGGAKNSKDFTRFLGHKSLFGSPIQIDYPDTIPAGMKPSDEPTKDCNDADPAYRCACVDCPDACPTLADVRDPRSRCRIGILSCWTFAIVIAYVAGLIAFVGGYLGYIRLRRRLKSQPSRLQLSSRDDQLMDDPEDEAILGVGADYNSTYYLNTFTHRCFYNLGLYCARYPYAIIGLSLATTAILSLGWFKFSIETNPVRLWVPADSVAAQQKEFFDETFGPFYRAQQIFLVNDTTATASVLSFETLQWWFDLEDQITKFTTQNISFSDVCFNPTGTACVIQSVTGYWQGDSSTLTSESWQEHLLECSAQPGNFECLPLFQQPLKPNMILGGYDEDILKSKALVASIVVANSLNNSVTTRAAIWEAELKTLLLEAQAKASELGLRMSFSTEISLEQELNKSTNTDAHIVVISYLVMFLYVSVALGGASFRGKRSFVESRFSLGFFGVLIVLLSVSASVGLFSFFSIKVTLIIAEVIPFLVLAVGVDNIFLLCHEFDRVNARYNERSIEERVASALATMGPSILLSASAEIIAFSLGALVGMPAVRNFAIYAAGAVLFDAVFQVTMFPAALAINQARVETNRVDCIPFLRVEGAAEAVTDHEDVLSRIIRRKYAPYLLRPYVKFAVFFSFVSLTILSLAALPGMQIGLDQKIALPSDSYLIQYFGDLEKYFGVGPPVYFVNPGGNATERAVQEALCGRFTACQQYSMANILEQERKRPDVSYILEPAASWIDDFFYWLNPTALEMCCRVHKNDHTQFCGPDDSERLCQPCFEDREQSWNISLAGMPEGEEFLYYAKEWLSAASSEDCPIAGKAPYSDAVILDMDELSLKASNARTFHTPLRTQSDYINSFAAARRIAREINEKTGLNVFPYAVHYIFFEQYATIVRLSIGLCAAALAAIFVVSSILLGSIVAAALLTVTITMVVIDIAGIMVLWGISLNALSLVNLVICIGIGVEFCAHFVRSYMVPTSQFVTHVVSDDRGREQRVWNALISVGSSVFTGITMCKLVGVIVLAFTRSKIFEIYYFRMWLSLVFVAAAHGLIFLPVLFALAGPTGYVAEDGDSYDDTDWTYSVGYTNALISSQESRDEVDDQSF